MKRFIPRDKLSKKKQREQDREQRVMWTFSPVTRRVESAKKYTRKVKHVKRDGNREEPFE